MAGPRLHKCFAAAALVAFATGALAQSPGKPPAVAGASQPSPELRAAMTAAENGDAKPLMAKADAGDADAQYYAGVLLIFGGKGSAPDPPKGCAYEQKASARRADAMHLVGMCHMNGAFGPPDKAKAEAAFTRADQMGFLKSKCALGRLMMDQPARVEQGYKLCETAAAAGDFDAEMTLGEANYAGTGRAPNLGVARRWYEKAAAHNQPQAMRRLGEMYASGQGGRKDARKAMELWTAAEKAGDPLVAILVADQMFSELTGGKKPGPGTYRFEGGVPVDNIRAVEDWYQQALDRDPRPDVRDRAKYALAILASLRTNSPSSRPPRN